MAKTYDIKIDATGKTFTWSDGVKTCENVPIIPPPWWSKVPFIGRLWKGQTLAVALLLLSLASPVLAGKLVYDLSGPGGGRIYEVKRDGDTTTVYGLTPGTADVTLGIRTGNGDRMVIGPPGHRQDEFAKGLAVEPGDDEGDGE